MRININVNIKVNHLVKYFILVDLALLAGWGLMEPLFSIFIIRNVQGATLITVGIFIAIYWFLKSLLQLPLANFLDKTDGERDDFYALVLGLFLAACSAWAFVLVTKTWELYLAQVLHALAFSLYGASWPAIFSRHLDKQRISFDWALDSTAVGIAAGCAGLVGAILAERFGFVSVFVVAGVLSAGSALILLFVPELVLPRKTSGVPQLRTHDPAIIEK